MKKTAPALTALALLALGLVGCSTSTDPSGTDETPLTSQSAAGTWVLKDGTGPEGEIKPLKDSPIDLTIKSDGEFFGSSGCNTISGAMTDTDSGVDMGAIAQTMMACDEEAMDLEFAYTQALDAVTDGSVSEGDLTLIGDGVKLRFESAD